MKRQILKMPVIAVLAIICVLCLSCTQFPTQFGYIGPEYVQTVGFVFSPRAEGAPGDTLRLRAYFEGEPVRSFACSLSTHYSMSVYGSDTAVDFKPLIDPDATFGPDSISVSFVIPQDFFAATGPLILSVLKTIPDSVKALFGFDSSRINSIPPSQLPVLAGQFLTSTDFSGVDPSLCQEAAHLAQVLSGQMVMHLAVNGGYTILRNISVRYNSHIRGDQFVFVNNNPDPQWIGIYKVKNSARLFFSPMEHTDDDTLFCLFRNSSLGTSKIGSPCRFTDTVLIDTGYTYYAIADSGIIIYDSTAPDGSLVTVKDTLLDRFFTYDNRVDVERYTYLWFYRPDTAEAGSVKPENSLIIMNSGASFSQFLPPLDTTVKKVSLWLRVGDAADGELNRPVAVTMKETQVVLRYTEKYASKVKKK
jgi:hypothetical protein